MANVLFAFIGLLFFVRHLLRFEETLKLVELTLFSSVLIVILLYDLRTWRIPLWLTVPAMFASLVFGVLEVEPTLAQRAVGALSGFLTLGCVMVIFTYVMRAIGGLRLDQFAMGVGDLVLLALIGSFTSYTQLPMILLLASLQGVMAYLALRLFAHQSLVPPKGAVMGGVFMPFGAFLCLAALELLALPS